MKNVTDEINNFRLSPDNNLRFNSDNNLRLYAWAPRHEVVYLQSILDAYEGLVRVRTEKHNGDQSLLLFLVQPSQLDELKDLLRHLSLELSEPINLI